MTPTNAVRICFIGFGEAGQAIASGLREAGTTSISAWDILFPGAEGERLRQAGAGIGVRLAASAADAVRSGDVVVSAVTAAANLEAARSVAPHLTGQFFLDINSVSPGRKQETARELAAARYVDVAVMAPVHPARHQTPMLLAGPHAETVEPLLRELGMKATCAGAEIGAAAAIKMVRSVMVKGMEALTYECFVAAARAGVTDEMEEVADTLRELGVAPLMAAATAERQRQMGRIGKQEKVRSTLREGGTALLGAVSAAAKDVL